MRIYLWIVILVGLSLVSCGGEADKPSSGSVSSARAKRARVRKTKPSQTFVSKNGRETNLVYSTGYYRQESCGVVELERQLEADPGNADLWYRLGLVWQSQMRDTSNAIVCFEKAIELAPGAYQPRIYLLNYYSQQNDKEKIQQTFIDLCACVTDERQCIGLIQQAMGLMKRGHVSKELLEEQFDSDDIVGCYLRASLSLQEKDYAAAGRHVIQGYELTTNKITRRFLGYIGRQLERTEECDADMRDELRTILLENMAPHLRALYNPATKSIQITAKTSVEEFNHALSLTTTEAERWEILRIVSVRINERNYGNTTELKEALKSVLSTNMPPERYMRDALRLYSALGLTNQSISYVQQCIDKPDLTAQKLRQLLSYLRDGNGQLLDYSGPSHYRANRFTPLSKQMEAILAQIVDRFPSNGVLLNIVAEQYEQSGCIQEALDTREQGLASETIPEHTRAQMAAKLIERYISEDMLEKAQEIMSEHEQLVHSYSTLATASARVYCYQNDTNGAWEVLSGCAQESRFTKERLGAAAALLDYRWHEALQITWIADTLLREMKGSVNVSGIINWQQQKAFVDILTQLDREDDLLAIVEQSFVNGNRWGGNNMLPKSLNADKFKAMIDRLEASGKTSQYMYSSLVEMSRALGFGKLELEMRIKAIGQNQRYYDVSSALRLAAKLKDTDACDRLAAMIEQTPKMAANINALIELGDAMRSSGLKERFDALLETRLTGMTNAPGSYVTQRLLRWGKTNAVEAIFNRMNMGSTDSFDEQNKLLQLAIQLRKQENEIAGIFDRLCQSADSTFDQQNKLLNLALQLKKKEYIQKCAGNLGDTLTNATAIARYGDQYLRALSQLARTDATYSDQREELLEEWLANKELDITVRHRLAQRLLRDSEACRDAMLALLAEEPDEQLLPQIQQRLLGYYQNAGNTEEVLALVDTMLENSALPDHMQLNLVRTLSKAGKPDRALELCERVMALSSDENQKKDAMNKAMQLCIELNAPERALEYADQIAAELRPGNTQQADSLISLYQKAGAPDKALKLCLDTMRMTSDGQQLNNLASSLKRLSQKHTMDVSEECQNIIAELGGKERTPERLAVMASLADIAGDSDAAFSYLEGAAQASLHPDRQAQYYEQLTRMCREQNMPDKELEVLEKSIKILEPNRQVRAVNRIVELLKKQNRYEDAMARGNTFMTSPEYALLETNGRDDFMRSMVDVCISAKDTDQAWEMAQNINRMSSYLNYAGRLNRLDEALPRIEKHLDSNAPANEKLYLMRDLLNVYRRNKKTDGIEATVSRLDALLADEVPAGMLTTVASLYESVGQVDKAISYMKQHCEEAQGNQRESGVTSLARMLQNNDRADEALTLLDAEPQSRSILDTKGRVLQGMKDYQGAVDAYLAAIETLPANKSSSLSNYAYTLATLARQCNDERTTGKIIDTVLARQDGPAYSSAAKIYERLRKYEDAAQCLAVTIEKTDNPDTKRYAMQRFANCSEKAKNYDDAIKTYDALVKEETTPWQQRVNYQQSMANVYKKADRPNAAREVLRDAVRECDREIKRLGKKQNAVKVFERKASLYRTIGDPSAARDTLQYIVDHYRGTSQANRAQKQLDRL